MVVGINDVTCADEGVHDRTISERELAHAVRDLNDPAGRSRTLPPVHSDRFGIGGKDGVYDLATVMSVYPILYLAVVIGGCPRSGPRPSAVSCCRKINSELETRLRPSPLQALFPRKPGFALLPEGPTALLGIRRPRDGSQGLRLVFHLAFHRTIGRLQEQALDPAIGFGGTRRQLSRDLLGFCKNRIVVGDVA